MQGWDAEEEGADCGAEVGEECHFWRRRRVCALGEVGAEVVIEGDGGMFTEWDSNAGGESWAACLPRTWV